MPQKKYRSRVHSSAVCFAFFIVLILFAACTKADVEYGSQLVGDQYSNIIMTDTFTVDVSTTYTDSFITSATGTGLAGSYNDEAFGQIDVSSYYQLQPPSVFADKDSSIEYDSVELILKRRNNFYGDSTKPLSLNVYQLTSQINKTTSTSFYNYDSLPYSSSPLGTKTFNVYPHITDTISIRLSDVTGKQLMSWLQTGSAEVSSADNFAYYFHGLTIVPNQANAFVFGFADSVIMRLHYRNVSSLITESKIADFTLYNNAKQFNHISVNRQSTVLANLNAKTIALPSTLTGNAAYTQPATSVMAKIRVPYIRDILNIPSYLKLEQAVLVIKPVVGTYSGIYTLPDSLRLTSTDKNNNIGSDITYTDGSTQYGGFTRDALYEENTAYMYDVTNYLTSQVNVTADNENGLLVRQGTDVANKANFTRVIIGDQTNKISRIQLQVYYLTVK